MKNKNDESLDRDAIFKAFSHIMSCCDDAIEDVVTDSWADITEMSSQIINVMMAIEFAYICYRNRLKFFMESLNDAAESDVFDDEDLRSVVEYARVSLRSMLKSVMMEDKKIFKKSLEVVSLDEETEVEKRINVKERGDA